MGTCYICGKQRVNYRRTVQTGSRYGYSSRGTAYTSTSQGMRTVCASCALDIDFKNKRHAMNAKKAVGIVVLALCAVFAPIIFIEMFATDGIFPRYTAYFKIIMTASTVLALIAGIVFIVLGVKSAHKKADVWYLQNKEKYIDDAYAKKAAMLEQSTKAVEQKNKTDEIIAPMRQAASIILNRVSQEMEILNAKANFINANYGTLNLATEQDCDNVLNDLKKYEIEMVKSKEDVSKLCNEYITQCKKYDVPQEIINDFTENVTKAEAMYANIANTFINQLKEGENQILQSKINILKQKS